MQGAGAGCSRGVESVALRLTPSRSGIFTPQVSCTLSAASRSVTLLGKSAPQPGAHTAISSTANRTFIDCPRRGVFPRILHSRHDGDLERSVTSRAGAPPRELNSLAATDSLHAQTH